MPINPTSAVSICNNALLRLGAQMIVALTDDSETARACSVIYPPARDALMRAHTWNFATKRASLTRHDVAPASGYDFQYYLPNDCVYVEDTDIEGVEDLGLSSWGVHPSWRIEQVSTPHHTHRVLLTDATTVVIRYVCSADPGVWDALFIEALIEDLAWKLAIPVTGKESLAKLHAGGAAAILQQAISRNARESGTVFAQPNTSLTRVRTSTRARIPGVTIGT